MDCRYCVDGKCTGRCSKDEKKKKGKSKKKAKGKKKKDKKGKKK